MSDIDFWISIGSTYSCLSVLRLDDVEKESGLSFDWRPFSVRAIMVEMDNIPFATKPKKAAYMWRDIGRRAAHYGLDISVPAPYPLKEFDLANQIAILGRQEGWCREYIVATYKRWFRDGKPAGSEPNLTESLQEIGQDPFRVISQAQTPEIVASYNLATDEARALGVFGAPSFVVDGELFWGDDRLEDAIAWKASH